MLIVHARRLMTVCLYTCNYYNFKMHNNCMHKTVCTCGVWSSFTSFDAENEHMSQAKHVTNICKTCFFHLRNINKIRDCLSLADTEKLVHAFITSNAVFTLERLTEVLVFTYLGKYFACKCQLIPW